MIIEGQDQQQVAVWFVVGKWYDKVSWHLTTNEPRTYTNEHMPVPFGPFMLSPGKIPQDVLDEIKKREDGPPVLPADVGIPETVSHE